MTGLLQRHFYCFLPVVLCNGLNIAESEVYNGHCTFEVVFDSWGMRSDENIYSGAIRSFDVVCVGSPVIMLQKKKANKFKEK